MSVGNDFIFLIELAEMSEPSGSIESMFLGGFDETSVVFSDTVHGLLSFVIDSKNAA